MRKKFDGWAKVIAIAVTSANDCNYLLQYYNSSDEPVIKMIEVNFKDGNYYENEQKVKYTMYTIDTTIYNINDMMGFAFFESGVFKDFYLTTVLDYLPEGTQTLNDGEFGNLGVVLTLTDDRSGSFFKS